MQALFTLTPSESKRLIGKAVAAMPEVQQARKKGYLLVGRGTTNAFILEELLKKKIDKERYTAGQVIKGVFCVLAAGLRTRPITLYKGKVLEVEPGTMIDKLAPGDIMIKGANAIDPFGNVGVVMASPAGGTMGQFYMPLKAQGLTSIYAVGLEKLVPSVEDAARYGGRLVLGKTIGARVGMVCVPDANVVTEIESIDILFGLDAVHYASGGWGGAEGSVTLIVEGEDKQVKKCMEFIEKIKGEPPLPAVKGPCRECDAPCSFRGKDVKDLPAYLR